MTLTKHAIQRCQQRGIPLKGVDVIMNYGSERYAPGGALRVCITNKDLERIRKEHREEEKRIERLIKKELVVDGNDVLTGYHKTKKQKNK